MINVIFDINTAAGIGSHGKLYINPLCAPVTYSGMFIETSNEPYQICGIGITASLAPANYSGVFHGKHASTPFYFSLPVGLDNSTVNVDNFLINQIPNAGYIAATAIQSLSSSYASSSQFCSTSSFASSLQLYNPTNGYWYSVNMSGSLGNETMVCTIV